jgi:hypothetical protein
MPPVPLRSALLEGLLEIGSGDPGHFRVSEDGDTTEIVTGSQGGYMAIPVFRVEGTALGTDGHCTYLDVHVSVGSLAPLDYKIRLPDSSPVNQYWYFEMLPLFLSSRLDDIVGQTASYSAVFTDDGIGASAQVRLLLVSGK